MKLIYTHENTMLLHSAKNILDSNNIESVFKNEHSSPSGPNLGISNIFQELWVVHDEDYLRAREILEREIINPEPKAAWTCPQCNEDNAGSFDFCWNCQTAKPA
tara:strand:- start:7601 stop:7912 length:312 start_codon:yes stop_codon:yes gene_type:complete